MLSSWGYIPKSRIAGSYANSTFSFLRNPSKCFSQLADLFHIPTCSTRGFQFLHIHGSTCCFPFLQFFTFIRAGIGAISSQFWAAVPHCLSARSIFVVFAILGEISVQIPCQFSHWGVCVGPCVCMCVYAQHYKNPFYTLDTRHLSYRCFQRLYFPSMDNVLWCSGVFHCDAVQFPNFLLSLLLLGSSGLIFKPGASCRRWKSFL